MRSREATGKTFQNNQFVLVLMGSLSIDVLFLQDACVCVWRTAKKPKPQNGMWQPGIPVWKLMSILLCGFSGVQNSEDFKAIEKKITE